MKDFLSYAWQIIKVGGKVAQDVAEAYLKILKKLFFFSILYFIVVGFFITLGVHLESGVINAIAIFLGAIFVGVWVIAAIPVMFLYRYAPDKIRYTIHEIGIGNRLQAIFSVALAFTLYFLIVPVWDNPSLIIILFILIAGYVIFYMKMREETSRKVLFITLGIGTLILTFKFYYPDSNNDVQQLKMDIVSDLAERNMVVTKKPVEVPITTTKPPTPIEKRVPKPEPIIVRVEKAPEPQKEVSRPEPPVRQPTRTPAPEPIPIPTPKETPPQIYESLILVVIEPQNLSDYNSSYNRFSGLGSSQFGGFSTGLGGFGFSDNNAINALKSELRKAAFQWGKENNVEIRENLQTTTSTRRRGDFFNRRGTTNQELPDADLYLGSTIGFRAEELSSRRINAGRIINGLLPRSRGSWRTRSGNRNSYEESSISLEILVTTYIFDKDQIIQATTDGVSSIETKIRSYDIAGAYSSSSQNNQLILSAIQKAVQDAVAKLKL